MRLVTICVAMLSCLLVLRYEASENTGHKLTELSVGTRLRPPVGFSWSGEKPTLVFMLRIGCVHCENEMPFYEKLLGLSRMNGIQTRLVAFFPDSKPQIDIAFANRLQGLAKLGNIDLQELHVDGTPTLVVVDETGIVRAVWHGELTAAQERAVTDAVTASSKAKATLDDVVAVAH